MDEQFTQFYKHNFNHHLKYLRFKYKMDGDYLFDVLQDIYLTFYQRHYINFDPTKSKLITYFTNYLNFAMLGALALKKKNEQLNISLETPVNDGMTLSDVVADYVAPNGYEGDKLDIVNSIIKNSRPNIKFWYDKLLLLAEGYSYQDVADMTGKNLQTTKSCIRTCRVYINKEYSKITGIEVEYKKTKDINAINKILNKKKVKEQIEKSIGVQY